MVTKGASHKKMRIMGRGRTGVGMIRSSHVTIKVDKVDFSDRIENARTPTQKALWTKRKGIVDNLRGESVPAEK